MSELSYSNRMVLWVDILGFSAIIDKSKKDHELIRVIYEATRKPQRLEADKFLYLDLGDLSELEVDVSAFSDTIILSCEPTIKGLFYIFMYYLRFTRQLRKLGLFSRGSLVIGEIYHRDNLFFGPAIIDAVNLEKKAIYPRVIIDNKVLDIIEQESNENKDVINRFIKKDYDFSYLHSLFDFRLVSNDQRNIHNIRNCNEFMRIINLNISSAIQMENKEEGDKILVKYLWLNRYFERITGYKNKDIEYLIHGDITKYEEGIYNYVVYE